MNYDQIKPYNPNLSREFSILSCPEELEMTLESQTQPVKRAKSLVRPERERIDQNHRQYHYRQAANQVPQQTIKSNMTENIPIYRSKSILGRNEIDNFEYKFKNEKKSCWTKLPGPWIIWCYLLTFWIPPFILKICGIPYGPPQKAWREKIGLVGIVCIIMGFVGFLTFGFTQTACSAKDASVYGYSVTSGYLVIYGWAYSLSDWNSHPPVNGTTNVLLPPMNGGGMDASFLFPRKSAACDTVFIPLQGEQPNYFPCELFDPNNTIPPDMSSYTNRDNCHLSTTATDLLSQFTIAGIPDKNGNLVKPAKVYYNYEDVNVTSHLMIYNGHVLNLRLLQSIPKDYFTFRENGLVSRIQSDESNFSGKDMTYLINSKSSWIEEVNCLIETIQVGQVDSKSVGCMFADIVLYVSLIVILSVILIKFALAVIFDWFLSWKLGNFKEEKSYKDRMKRQEQIENWTRSMSIDGPVSLQPKKPKFLPKQSRFTPLTRLELEKQTWRFKHTSSPALSVNFNSISQHGSTTVSNSSNQQQSASSSITCDGTSTALEDNNSSLNLPGSPCPLSLSPYVVPKPPTDYMPFNYPLAYTICLVTCYSEGPDGIRCTLDSIAVSDYPKSHTLLLVICDGLITGSGESESTPEVCINMMCDFIIPPDQVQPQPYVAIADGSKRNNYAKVYAGFYQFNNDTVPIEQQSRVPMITIVKCGTPQETVKAGNRGKRDSQIILMSFLQKVMFNERMTMMEYEFFNAIWRVTGVSPDHFEICLMVDADTKLFPDALSRLISAAVKDPEISGLCGETKIANKTGSWVTMIQVFEYYISHHQSKAFESIFGGVTCLPGCFCMYRIKAPKGPHGYWVPILANPDIVQHYSENVVNTLHRKNLLLLGEDRYLTTLMLRTFPNRKMIFVPQAVCKTIVPDTFMVLLSQRRRWINSTVHNFFELILVNDLCGTFCFSMQFFVFMDLVGTLSLPAAIAFTLYIIVLALMGQPAVVPLILLALILGLPAVLIVMTSRKIVYIGWMLVYLISLPIWNFVLPVYAFWHFDDFSWGDTRKVQGVKKDTGHGDEHGEFDSTVIVMKKWNEYELDRRIQERNASHPGIYKKDDIHRKNSELYNTSTRASSTQDDVIHDHDSSIHLERIQLFDPPMNITTTSSNENLQEETSIDKDGMDVINVYTSKGS